MDEKRKPKETVLVIDDDAVVGLSYDRALSESGYVVSTALDGRSGLDLLDASHFDLVLTDLNIGMLVSALYTALRRTS
jgi:DNA-binding response OmpR family regulator